MFKFNPTNILYKQPKTRLMIPAAAAILLTFGRGTMLPFENIITLLDHTMNVFVLITALFTAYAIALRIRSQNLKVYLPIIALICWVSLCVLMSPSQYWPSQTAIIDVGCAILICSQVLRDELRRVRHFVLILSGLFSLVTLFYGQQSLGLIFSGSLNERLGIEFSPANVVAFPRIMYVLVLTSIVSMIVEKKTWLKVYATLVSAIPMLIAMATAGRGPLMAFIVAALTFNLAFGALGKKRDLLFSGLVIVMLLVIAFFLVVTIFPLTEQRIIEGGHDEASTIRVDMWKNALDVDNISLFGTGIVEEYPHNIFLEFYLDYGIVGLILFLWFIVASVVSLVKCYRGTHDQDVLWVISIVVLQMVSQQLSLNIYWGYLWAAIVLPLSLDSDFPTKMPQFEKLGRVHNSSYNA